MWSALLPTTPFHLVEGRHVAVANDATFLHETKVHVVLVTWQV